MANNKVVQVLIDASGELEDTIALDEVLLYAVYENGRKEYLDSAEDLREAANLQAAYQEDFGLV